VKVCIDAAVAAAATPPPTSAACLEASGASGPCTEGLAAVHYAVRGGHTEVLKA